MGERIEAENQWKALVEKQIGSSDFLSRLRKENLESLEVNPIYFRAPWQKDPLPMVEESTALVAPYEESLEGEVYAFLLDHNVEGLEEVSLYLNNRELCEHILTDERRVFSLVEVFDPLTHEINEQLGKEFLAKGMEKSLCIDVAKFQNAGASIIQQLSYALAQAKELVEVFGEGALEQILFKVAVGGEYFFEIAKVRALKLLFHELGKEYGLDIWPYIFAQPSERNKSKFDEENNLIRSTLELSSAMIGGADAVFAKDYKLSNADKHSQEISFKQQIILAYESLINVFGDALSGSYYVESLTKELGEKAWEKFLEIEEKGGMIELLKSGAIAQEIFESAVKEHEAFQSGKKELVGVNIYPKREETRSVESLYDSKEIKPVRLAEIYE